MSHGDLARTRHAASRDDRIDAATQMFTVILPSASFVIFAGYRGAMSGEEEEGTRKRR